MCRCALRGVLPGHDDHPAALSAYRLEGVVRPGQHRYAGHRVVGVERPEPVAGRAHPVGREVRPEQLLERRPELGGHLLDRELDLELGAQHPQRRREAGHGVDQGHVQVEADRERRPRGNAGHAPSVGGGRGASEPRHQLVDEMARVATDVFDTALGPFRFIETVPLVDVGPGPLRPRREVRRETVEKVEDERPSMDVVLEDRTASEVLLPHHPRGGARWRSASAATTSIALRRSSMVPRSASRTRSSASHSRLVERGGVANHRLSSERPLAVMRYRVWTGAPGPVRRSEDDSAQPRSTAALDSAYTRLAARGQKNRMLRLI